jgi:hypothetical protein
MREEDANEISPPRILASGCSDCRTADGSLGIRPVAVLTL